MHGGTRNFSTAWQCSLRTSSSSASFLASLLAADIFNAVIGEGFAPNATLDVRDLSWRLWLVFGACLAAALLIAWRVDVNEFSVHLLYRNRLARCFLGASVPPDRPFQPFTGFSSKGDPSLADITSTTPSANDGRPFPILNATLNVFCTVTIGRFR